MNFDDPVDEDCSHLFVNVLLLLHVMRRGGDPFFFLLQHFKNVTRMLSYELWVAQVLVVNRRGEFDLDLFYSAIPELIQTFLYVVALYRHVFIGSIR